MVIYGLLLLSFCYIVGQLFGAYLGQLLGIEANVGGVGFAMLLLILLSDQLLKRGLLAENTKLGITFWSQIYIPVIIAMAAIQNVKMAISGGWIALLAGAGAVFVSFLLIPLIVKYIKN